MFEQARPLGSEGESLAVGNVLAPVLRLLVVDDDHLHRMIICRAATKSGYAPVGAATYDEAAKLAQETAFDCVTLDLSLGQHAGVEMLRHLWVIGYKAPIVIISGCDEATCIETVLTAKALDLNIADTIQKPVDLAVLRQVLERLRAAPEDAAASLSAQISPA
jgi:DNA-binding response OmpR family regulator